MSGEVRSDYLQVGDLRLHHTVAGRGAPPLLLIHGLGSAGYIEWRANLSQLGRARRVLAPDLPGFGRSDKPAQGLGVAYFAAILERYLRHLRVRTLDVAGASLGGRVAIEVALRSRVRVRRLVLVNALGLGRPRLNPFYPLMSIPRVGEAVMQVMGAGLRRASPATIRRFAGRWSGSQAELEAVMDDAYLADLRELHAAEGYPSAYLATVRSLVSPRALVERGRLLARLRRAAVPLLIVWGTEDPLFPVDNAMRAHAELPGSRLALITGAGHTPQAERPEEFNRLVSEFLAS